MDTLLQLWGKKSTKADGSHRPLLFHMLDVAFVVQALWNHSLQRGIKARLKEQLGLSEMDTIACLSFWAGLHDIGKASPAFQKQSEPAKAILEKEGFHFPPYSSSGYHATISTKVLQNMMPQILHCDTTNSEEFIEAMSVAIGGHHGSFPTSRELQAIGRRELGDSQWSDARRSLIQKMWELAIPEKSLVAENRPSHSFYVAFAALTSVADWIGSNEEFFPYEADSLMSEHYVQLSKDRAEDALVKLGWTTEHLAVANMKFLQLFPEIKETRPLQEATLSLAEGEGKPSMVLIEAPMGEGKTEASLYLAHLWQAGGDKQGYYVALPTQATSNQMFARVKSALEQQYTSGRVNLQLVHGESLLNERFQQLRLASVGDEPTDVVVAAGWFLNRKRGLLAPFGVGTIDQALLSVLQTRHFFVRLLGLCQKTVIIDEVHAYDTYMSTLLERALQWLAALGSPVVLLSATLPAERRKALFEAYNSGKTLALPEQPYPRITWLSNGRVSSKGFGTFRTLKLRLESMNDDIDRVVGCIVEATAHGGYVAVICNTVKRAQSAYLVLKRAGFRPGEELQLLHSKYPYAQREEREHLVLKTFGKGGQRGGKAVVVSTQIIEQSLDLDFDLMITDLAPADLVIQRAGRIFRHEHHRRPAKIEGPTLRLRMPMVTNTGMPDFGESGYVYDKYTLLRSYLSLKGRDAIAIPEDIEAIIEEVYGASPPSWPSKEVEEEALRLREESERRRKEEGYHATGNIVAGPDSRDGPASYLMGFNKQLEEDAPELHRSLQALTRLAGPSVQVICLHRCGDALFCRPDGSGSAIDHKARLQPEDITELLKQSLTITRADLVHEILANGECSAPAQWGDTAALRHKRRLIFDNRICRIGPYRLTLDDELGLLVEKI